MWFASGRPVMWVRRFFCGEKGGKDGSKTAKQQGSWSLCHYKNDRLGAVVTHGLEPACSANLG